MITAIFNPGETTATAEGLYKFDYGQTLRIKGLSLPKSVSVQFATAGMSEAVTAIGTTAGNQTDVTIPNSILRSDIEPWDYVVTAYFYIADNDVGKTEYVINIPVKYRPRTGEEQPDEDVKKALSSVLADVSKAANRAELAVTHAEKRDITVDQINATAKDVYRSALMEELLDTIGTGYAEGGAVSMECEGWTLAHFNLSNIYTDKLQSLSLPVLNTSAYEAYCIPFVFYNNEGGYKVYRPHTLTVNSWAFYSANGNYITLTAAGVEYLSRNYPQMYITIKGGCESLLADYGENYLDGLISQIPDEKVTGKAELVYNPEAHLLAGYSYTLYARHLVMYEDAGKFAAVKFEVSGIGTYIEQEGQLTFAADDITGNSGKVKIYYYRNNTVDLWNTAEISVYKVTPSASAVTCDLHGDSWTGGGFYQQYAVDRMAADGCNVSWIGINPAGTEFTYGPWKNQAKPVNNGMPGGFAHTVSTMESFNGYSNPFYNPDTGCYDYGYYLTQNGFTAPDIVLLNWGMNAQSVLMTDGTYGTLEQNTAAYEQIITSVRAAAPNAKILIWDTPLPCKETSADVIEWAKRQEIWKHLHEKYAGREGEGIYLYPAGAFVETRPFVYNREKCQMCAEADMAESYWADPTTERVTDKLHPNHYGPAYKQTGQMMYSAIMWVALQNRAS